MADAHVRRDRAIRGADGIHRRTFLKASGLSVLGVAGVSRLLGSGVVADAADVEDPITLLAAELSYDVESIFRFVSDEIRYEPYAGILRGARGTLRARAGNSADQALLLAELLRASLATVRFVSGPLDPAHADALLAAAPAGDAAAVAARARAILGGPGVEPPAEPPEEFQAILDRLEEVALDAQAIADDQATSGIRTIVDALAEEGITLPTDTSQLPALERDQHVWVQVAFGTDWQDLDPTLPGQPSGEVIASPSGEPADALPDDLRHRIDFVATAERMSGASLAQEAVFEYGAFADELAGVPIAMVHAKPEGLANMGLSITGVITDAVQYLPVLAIGDQLLVGTPISFTGGGGIVSDLDEQGDRNGEATAEWLEVRVTSPDGATSSATRTIFDRVGSAARAAGDVDVAAIPPVELMAIDEDATREFLPVRTVRFLAVATGPSSADEVRQLRDDEEGPGPYPVGGILYHLGRDSLASALAPAEGVEVFLDRPNVVAYTVTGEESQPAGTPSSFGLDVLHRSFGVLPVQGSRVAAPPGVVAGVVGHVAERLALGDGLAGDLAPASEVVSVGRLFDLAAADGIGVRVLRGSIPTDLGLLPDSRARLEAALASGLVAVAPASPVSMGGRERLGWWLVDPATGRTTDEMDDGTGSSATEYHAINALVSLWSQGRYIRLGICLYHLIHTMEWFIKSMLDFSHFLPGLALHFVLHWPLHHWGRC
jgi:hypothetical protein